MAPLSTPSILSTPSPFYCSRFSSSTDRGSSLTRGRRYNYGRWEGFKYSCFHYGAGLLLAQREESKGFFSLKITFSSIVHLLLFFSGLTSRFLPSVASSIRYSMQSIPYPQINILFRKKFYSKGTQNSDVIESISIPFLQQIIQQIIQQITCTCITC